MLPNPKMTDKGWKTDMQLSGGHMEADIRQINGVQLHSAANRVD
ncbi:hypothetical protein [Mesorhizobium sp. M0016]